MWQGVSHRIALYPLDAFRLLARKGAIGRTTPLGPLSETDPASKDSTSKSDSRRLALDPDGHLASMDATFRHEYKLLLHVVFMKGEERWHCRLPLTSTSGSTSIEMI